MICRIWRGWTTTENAAAYEALLRQRVVPGIEARRIPGFRRIEMMRRPAGDEVEFATIMWFDDLEAIREFVGDDADASDVPRAARDLLSRFEQRAVHYEILDRREQGPGE